MPTPILATKLYRPPLRPTLVRRPRLLARLNTGLPRKLTLISAPAGFGKTTLVSEWITQAAEATKPLPPPRVAWLSLDEGDSDPVRFLVYWVAALQSVLPSVGQGVANALQSPPPPPPSTLLTTLLNEITTAVAPSTGERIILVLDDYHRLEDGAVDPLLTFLLDYLPPQLHLVIATREDPPLPLARLRARGQLTEVRAADLRFTPAEAADFLNQAMGLALTTAEVTALEARTEGWIAGLQLAALSLQGQEPRTVASFIQSFSGSHRFVMDYLVEEVLQQQPTAVQHFLLRTAILERFCGPLCDAVLNMGEKWGMNTASSDSVFVPHPSSPILAYLEQANLFIIPLDNERRWYRYHHLFAELLRQRLQQSITNGTSRESVAEYHLRASDWYAANGFAIDAFQHAVAAQDVDRAARLVEGDGMPLHFRGAQLPILKWLASLPTTVLDAKPALWVIYASALLFAGKNSDIEQKLQAAEAALSHFPADPVHRDLRGHVASIRAFLAIAQNQAEVIAAQSQRALDYLLPENLAVRTAATWSLGYAYQLQGQWAAAKQTHRAAIAISQSIGHTIIQLSASIGLGQIQEAENQLAAAAAAYQSAIQVAGDPPLLVACEAYLGLGRVLYAWNDLAAAQQAIQQALQLASQIELISTWAACQVWLARLQLAAGNLTGALALLAEAETFVQQHHFIEQRRAIITTQVRVLLQQGKVNEAAQRVQAQDLPLSQARVALAQGDPTTALALLVAQRQAPLPAQPFAEALEAMLLQVLAYQRQGLTQMALDLLNNALTQAVPSGIIRPFVDEGQPMHILCRRMQEEGGGMKDYLEQILAAFASCPDAHAAVAVEQSPATLQPAAFIPQPSLDPLSERELEVLHLIAQGLSNQAIGDRLFLALDTVKGHNRRIFAKLQVQRRTEAVAKARELKLIREA
ncbi:MAG: AAA family ATPase [Caldilineaceae bacterium]|nr:AAA family ATPase [Caldilineaceae bacterium]